jgi:rhodanese-related sulfurtransferase
VAPPALPAAAAYVLYCSHGVRSRSAAEILGAAGLAGVRHLDGGLARWDGPLTTRPAVAASIDNA